MEYNENNCFMSLFANSNVSVHFRSILTDYLIISHIFPLTCKVIIFGCQTLWILPCWIPGIFIFWNAVTWKLFDPFRSYFCKLLGGSRAVLILGLIIPHYWDKTLLKTLSNAPYELCSHLIGGNRHYSQLWACIRNCSGIISPVFFFLQLQWLSHTKAHIAKLCWILGMPEEEERNLRRPWEFCFGGNLSSLVL